MLYYVKKATMEDLNRVMEVIYEGVEILKNAQIPQWQDENIPPREVLRQDILNEDCFVLVEQTQIVGVAVLQKEPEDNYKTLDSGKWLHDNQNYHTIHRFTISPNTKEKGLAKLFMSHLISEAYRTGGRDIRIDTHQKNIVMQHIIAKFDFSECGTMTIPIRDGERLVYQLLL